MGRERRTSRFRAPGYRALLQYRPGWWVGVLAQASSSPGARPKTRFYMPRAGLGPCPLGCKRTRVGTELTFQESYRSRAAGCSHSLMTMGRWS